MDEKKLFDNTINKHAQVTDAKAIKEEAIKEDKIQADNSKADTGWAEKRQALYERIDMKVGMVKEIRAFANEVGDSKPEELRKFFDVKFNEIIGRFSEEKQGKFQKRKKLYEKFLKLLDRKKKIENEYDNKYEEEINNDFVDDNEWKRLNKMSSAARDGMEEIDKDNDIIFLNRVDGFFNNLIKKRGEVIECKRLYEDNADDFYKKSGINNSDENEVQFSSYSANIIIDSGAFEDIAESKSIRGIHNSGTVLNLIKRRPGYETTVQHEENHNLSESFVRDEHYSSVFISYLREKTDMINQLKKLNSPESILKAVYKTLQDRIEEYAYRQYQEILADVDNLAEGNINTFLTNFKSATNSVYDFSQTVEDRKAQEIIMTSWEKMKANFAGYLERLSYILFSANKTEKIEDIKAAIILFKPEEIINIEKYTKYKIGKDNYKFYRSLQPLICEGCFIKEIVNNYRKNFMFSFFDDVRDEEESSDVNHAKVLMDELYERTSVESFFYPENISTLYDLLSRAEMGKKLTEADKENISQSIKGANPYSARVYDHKLPLLKLPDFLQTLQQLEFIGEKLGVKEISERVERIFSHSFFLNNFKKCFQGENWLDMEEIYTKWPFSRSRIDELLLRQIDNKIIFDRYENLNDITYTDETIKESGFWKFLEKVGLDQKAETLLKNQD